MTAPDVLVVSIDGFGVAAAGAYGQTSLPTPGWDALAAHAVTFDFVEAPGAARESVFAAFARPTVADRNSVADAARRFGEAGGETRLAGDLEDVLSGAAESFATAFDERRPFDLESATAPVSDEDATHALRWLALAEREIASFPDRKGSPSSLLWLHHSGAYGAWDAPLDWREALRDEEDPPAYAGVEPPQIDERGQQSDPDRFLPYVFAWAGQAAAWDRLAEGLFLLWKRRDAKRPTNLIVLGLRGYPLGEHGVVGDGDLASGRPALHEERLHVPFFLVPSGGAFPGRRSLGVRRSDELLADLIAAREITPQRVAEENDAAFALAREGESVSIRTVAWRYVQSGAESRLYFKPDDKWEANDVAARRRGTVEAFERWLEERRSGADPPLPEEATRL